MGREALHELASNVSSPPKPRLEYNPYRSFFAAHSRRSGGGAKDRATRQSVFQPGKLPTPKHLPSVITDNNSDWPTTRSECGLHFPQTQSPGTRHPTGGKRLQITQVDRSD